MIYSDRVKFKEFIDPCLCNAWVATAVIGAGVIGAGAQMWGASEAADAQREGAAQSAAISREMYEKTRGDLAPYRAVGQDASTRMTNRLSELTEPISVNPDDFLKSDYYKFLEKEGNRAVTNSSAARGLASSGAALKGAAAFAKGLNSQEWKSNFEMQRANKGDAYSRLKALIDTGQTAAAGTGAAGTASATQQGNAAIGSGNASAAQYNAMGGSIANLASNIGGYAAYQGMYGNPAGGGITYGNPNGPTPFGNA